MNAVVRILGVGQINYSRVDKLSCHQLRRL